MLLQDVNLRIAISSKCNMNCLYCKGSLSYRHDKPGAMEDFRKKPLKAGNIDINTLLKILKSFKRAGFKGIAFTGGEPLLNKNWDTIVREAAKLNYERIEITTNGTLLEEYLNKADALPIELTKVKISMDTIDRKRFKLITGGGDLNKIISALKRINRQTTTRANKVIIKSELECLPKYIKTCEELGFQEISLLDLVYYSNRDRKEEKLFFQKEFVSFQEIRRFFKNKLKIDFFASHKYGHALIMPSGTKIIMKDSNIAVRDENCLNCPVYCQEGIYTVRIATDGNITYCPDYKAELPSIDGPAEIKKGTLREKAEWLANKITSAKKLDSFEDYAKKHAIRFK